MNPVEAKKLLKLLLSNRKPVMLVGPPGTGKTDIIYQVAHELGADMQVSHPVVNDPTDAKGLPCLVDGEAKFLPFEDLRFAISYEGDLLIWFLDDLGQAPPAVQAAYMQLLLARRINGHKLPDTIVFVAATNRRQALAGVSGILEPVKSRFHAIIELEPDVDSLTKWGLSTEKLRKEIIACLRLYPELLSQDPSKEIKASVCPRTWEFASQMLDMGMDNDMLFGALCSCIGDGPGAQLYGMITVFKDLPSVKAIVRDPDGVEIPEQPSSMHALCTVLSKHLGKVPADVDSVFQFAGRLPGDFSVILINDSLHVNPGLADTKAFIKWNSKHVDLFIG